jgi:tetratricopeptide (TPR) repeat protein
MTWERMNDLLKQMGKQDVKLIDKDLGFELCRREGIHAIVIGTFVKAGDAFATDVKVLDVVTKELLKTASVRGDGVQRILTSQIDFAEARNQIQAYRDAILRTSPQTPVYIQGTVDLLHAILFLKAGRVDSARIRTNAFRSALPSVEYIRSTLQMLGGILEGEVLLAERKPDSAIAVCRAAPVIGPSNAVGWRMALYSVPEFRDLVPRAFQMKGNLDSAIVEYERLMTLDTNSVDRRWSQPLYHYRLATVCMKAGKNDKARAEFTRFLEIWKDADKDRAEFRDAKKQLARLGNSSQ